MQSFDFILQVFPDCETVVLQTFLGNVELLELGFLAEDLVLLAHVVAPLAEGWVGLVPDLDVAVAVLRLEVLELLEAICVGWVVIETVNRCKGGRL